MPAREPAPLGAPIWIDLASGDTARAADFYSALFGWTASEGRPEYGGYVTFSKDGSMIAGMMPNHPGSGFPDAWGTFFAVADSGATVASVEQNGGRVLVEPMTVDVQGTMAVFVDSTGTTFQTWQPDQNTGFELSREHGTPAWHELVTHDYTAAIDFYRTVLGWETRVESDTEDYRYTVHVADGVDRSGIEDGSRGGAAAAAAGDGATAPASWVVYFWADDVDAAVAVAVEHGGSVVDPPTDSPYGRTATVADPTGARFSLLQTMPAEG
ncbi:lactoylglutathione lyase family protein [Sanguibacter keddieii DSM 10542]|uniref:Lactoylglutathione lyase family protein n=1 Tax=Sanguibacter keddieii (strain ATCC 51767 / DSM 10542 / NCFB 3025 / ST-74) TaxID=446469 RepID=D1BGB3_SANKS|nr:VOC family protein [Sanguibacter keddieii]ACZ23630.1 lactoylglutathione lyase family protein [Sanguibacter keddieii DSM 10542]